MNHSLPTWLRVIRITAVLVALSQIAHSFIFIEHTLFDYLVSSVIVLLAVGPWFYTPRSWIWWPTYSLSIYVTYRFILNVITIWKNQLLGISAPLTASSLEIRAMVVYGTFMAIFFVVQILVLPFFRKITLDNYKQA